MSREKKFYYQRDKAYISLESKLYNIYLKKEFLTLDKAIIDFLQNELPLFFNIKSKYSVYNQAILIEYQTFKKNYIPSLKKLTDDNLIIRSKIDSELLINMPSMMLTTYDKFQRNKKKLIKAEEETETEEEKKELLALILFLTFNPITPAGKGLKKLLSTDIWNSVFSKNSRASHMVASGQVRGNDGYFIVGGERFRYPGDWSMASIGNVINCQCYLTSKIF